MSDDPFTAIQSAAIQMHELLLAYVAAGFTREEAFDLVKTALIENMRQQ